MQSISNKKYRDQKEREKREREGIEKRERDIFNSACKWIFTGFPAFWCPVWFKWKIK